MADDVGIEEQDDVVTGGSHAGVGCLRLPAVPFQSDHARARARTDRVHLVECGDDY